jgi:cell division septum initiation protein DivIVA
LLGENFLGPVVIYPLERDRDTPLTVYTPADVLRETLGAGPCEYVLDAEGLKPRPPGGKRELLRGAVCATTYTIEGFFWRGLEIKDRQIVCDLADDAAAFIETVNARIQEYRKFAREILDLCEKARKDSPQLAPVAEKIASTANQIEKDYGDRLSVIKTPSDSAKVAEQVKALTLQEDPENLGRYLALGDKLRHIAGTQDGLMGRCRLAVKRLRQEAALATAAHPEAADLAARIRKQARQILRKKHSMEGK